MYILDTVNLKSADIILIRKYDEVSKRIIKQSGSKYSHAMIFTKYTSVLESDGLGVQTNDLRRILIEDPKDILVLRHKDLISEQQREKIVSIVRFSIGTEYSTLEARRSISSTSETAIEPNRQYCTRLIAQAYHQCNLPIVENQNYNTPKDFEESPSLIQLDSRFFEVSEDYIKTCDRESPSNRQRDLQNLIFEDIRILTHKDIQNFTQLIKYLLKDRTHADEILSIYEKHNYFDFKEIYYQLNPDHFDERLFFDTHKTIDDQRNEIDNIYRITNDILKRFNDQLRYLEQLEKEFPNAFFQRMIEHYKDLIRLNQKRIKFADKIRVTLANTL